MIIYNCISFFVLSDLAELLRLSFSKSYPYYREFSVPHSQFCSRNPSFWRRKSTNKNPSGKNTELNSFQPEKHYIQFQKKSPGRMLLPLHLNLVPDETKTV